MKCIVHQSCSLLPTLPYQPHLSKMQSVIIGFRFEHFRKGDIQSGGTALGPTAINGKNGAIEIAAQRRRLEETGIAYISFGVPSLLRGTDSLALSSNSGVGAACSLKLISHTLYPDQAPCDKSLHFRHRSARRACIYPCI